MFPFTIKKVLTGIVVVGTMLVFLLALRGLPGNPSSEALGKAYWSYDGPLELSPERGRFALLYSIVEDRSLIFSASVARLALPDLAMNSAGQYVSLFAPAVSYLVVPGYIIGKFFGVAQVGAYAVIVLFALANIFLIFMIAKRLGAGMTPAMLGALTFAFATPAFPYATTLYQHHISVFLLLVSLWILLTLRSVWSLIGVWFACALAVVVDNPNLFLMFPVGVYALMRLRELVRVRGHYRSRRVFAGLLTFVGFIIPLALFGYYNFRTSGSPWQLPGTLQAVSEITDDGYPVAKSTYERQVLTPEQLAERERGKATEKTAVGFFKTRNLYEGFYVHFLSPDRGILFFTPVILLGIIGLGVLYRRQAGMVAFFLAIIGGNVLLYSMWGDPWGGWAFGSRYLIPSYALLAIALPFGFSLPRFRSVFLGIFILLFAYSAWVNTLGAVTSSANPPKVQVLAIEQQTGHEEKYTFLRNWEFLHEKYQSIGSKSFVYQSWAKQYFSAPHYFGFVYIQVLILFFVTVLGVVIEWYGTKKS